MVPKLFSALAQRSGTIAIICCCLAATSLGLAEDKADSRQSIKHQVTGLFSAGRVRDLQKTAEKLPGMKLMSVDFDTAEAVFLYDSAAVFPNMAPEKIVEEFDNRLKQASFYTFGIKPLCKTPRDKLKRIEIAVVGLDCKACSLAAYEAVYKLEGVEQATASFKEGLVTAWIHPEKTDRAKLEEALVKKGVTLKNRAEK